MPTSGNRRTLSLFLVFLLLVGSVAIGLGLGTNTASGDEAAGSPGSGAPTAAQTKEALESGNARPILEEPETDLRAAQAMPHRDLERDEALELAEAVFEPELESIGGIYEEIEPERYLSDNTAIIDPSSIPEELAGSQGQDLAAEHPNAGVLIESTLPLRTENALGEKEAVDLELQSSEGELQPQNPLAEVGLPMKLGEGISLPGPGVEITVSSAPGDRAATDAEGQFAFYPEIAESTDLIATPAPRGVEMMTDVRSAEAPRQTTYNLTLPAGAELRQTENGGAEVVEGGHSVVVVPPPTALDAAGNPVQTELTVSGDEMTVITTPDLSTAYPILVDPTFETPESWSWAWNHDTEAQWVPSTTNASAMNAWTATRAGTWGLDLTSGLGGNGHPLDNTNWDWVVPRYLQDLNTYKEPPSTWVYALSAEGIFFIPYGNYANYPALVLGLVDPGVGWATWGVHYGGQGEMNSWTNHWSFPNPSEMTDVKSADMNLVTYEEEDPSKVRDTYVSSASVVYVDNDAPVTLGLNPPTHWASTVAAPASYEFQDKGLGMKYVEVIYNGSVLTQVSLACDGRPLNPCPRRLTQAQQPLNFSTAALPTGRDWVTVTGSDPVFAQGIPGHSASGTMLVKVDHTAPEAVLSGALTEQGSLGTRLPSYPLRVSAEDGTAAAPQSGVKKVEIKVDGAPVIMPEQSEWEPNCQTENCGASSEWTLNSSAYAAGPHEVQVIATDGVGNTTTKTLQIELRHPAPTLSVSGSLTEQATLGTELPSYKLQVAASAQAESPPAAGLPAYSSSFGTSGTGSGQFAHPGDVAVGNEGALFVVDTNNNRIEKFSASGVFASELGTKQIPAECQLSRPTAIAVTAAGNLAVADSGHKRVVELSPAGACLLRFGAAGTGAGQFAGSGPEGIAIDYHGNIWVSDTYGGRLEKFGEEGKFIRSVGTKGTAYEQLGQPTAVEAAPGGQIYVTDWEDDKVAEYGEGGAFIRQFGSQGNEPGQLQQPTGIAIDSRGNVWVGDQNNQRVEEFNQAGEYLRRFGAEGTGAGQFRFQYPIGIATDTAGDIWVTDPLDNRVEKWVSAGYATPGGPTFLRSFGSAGKGAAQFETSCGLASDGKGDVWVSDLGGARVEKLTESGVQLLQLGTGTAGPGANQFNRPCAVATDRKGHVFVDDIGNGRIQEYSESGTFIRSIVGTGTNALLEPLGVAVDAKGHVWVADSGHGRLEEFSETGAFMKTLATPGSGAGHLLLPRGIAFTASGQIWVVDQTGNRLYEFNESGGLLKEVGGEGSGPGRFHTPTEVAIDAAGDLWVTDLLNQRVVELASTGEFIRQFGTAGTGTGQFQTPVALALDGNGHAFVNDYSVDKIDEWNLSTAHSQVSTEITVDGKRVDAGEAGCAAETCPLSREWSLNSSAFTPGSHAVVIRATDGLGNTTTKTLNVNVGDTTKPALEVGGELSSAPEGWVQQEKGAYGLHATATDKGFGVTALRFTMDGKSVASKEQSCPAGKCPATISTSVDVRDLAAGAHEAEVVAIDGAGNRIVRGWTLRVDPDGELSVADEVATAEAFEETAGVATIERPILTASEEEEPSTVEPPQQGQISVGGTNVPITLAQNPTGGTEYEIAGRLFLEPPCSGMAEYSPSENGEPVEPEEEAIPICTEKSNPLTEVELEQLIRREEEEVANGTKSVGLQPITVAPVNTAAGASEMTPVNGEVAAAANTGHDANTVFRPISDGGYSFGLLTSPAAAEHFAFELGLSPELELVQTSSEVVSVQYSANGPLAFTITALAAHDGIGTAVPTHIAVTGPDVITLTVEHRGPSPAGGNFVYPVVGGTGWEGGFRSISFEMNEPPPPSLGEAEVEEWELEQLEGGNALVASAMVGPPEEIEPLTLSEKRVLEINPASSVVKLRKKFEFNVCRPRKGQSSPVNVEGPSQHREASAVQNLHFHCFDPNYEGNYWLESVSGRFHMVFENKVWLNWKEWGCSEGGEWREEPYLEHCEAFYPNGAHYASGTRIAGPVDPMAQWRFGIEQGHWAADYVVKCMQMGGKLFPNPRQNLHPYEEPMIYQRPSKVQSGEPCHAFAP